MQGESLWFTSSVMWVLHGIEKESNCSPVRYFMGYIRRISERYSKNKCVFGVYSEKWSGCCFRPIPLICLKGIKKVFSELWWDNAIQRIYLSVNFQIHKKVCPKSNNDSVVKLWLSGKKIQQISRFHLLTRITRTSLFLVRFRRSFRIIFLMHGSFIDTTVFMKFQSHRRLLVGESGMNIY